MRTLVWIALAAMLAWPAPGAHAQVQGQVFGGAMSYGLYDLDPNDGVDPSISFYPMPAAATASARGTITHWRGQESAYVQEYGSGTDPFSISLRMPHAEAAGRTYGDPYAGSASLEADAAADGSGGTAASVLFSLSSFEQGFVLSPNTGLLVTGTIGVNGRVSRPGESFEGFGQLMLRGMQEDGTYASYLYGDFARASFDPGDEAEVGTSFNVEIGYWNARPEAVDGSLSMSLFAYAVSPVPEPASLPLAAAGAGLLLLRWRRCSSGNC